MPKQRKNHYFSNFIPQSTIKVIDDNPLLILNRYTNLKLLACDISEKSVAPKDGTKNNSDKTNDNEKKQ